MADGLDGAITLRVDVERERLAAELGVITDQLVTIKLEREDAEVRLRAFAVLHDRTLAPVYADLDDVLAEIAELLAERSGLASDREDAIRARERADASARAAEQAVGGGVDDDSALEQMAPERQAPSEDARELFRAVIKRCHPDLAADDDDRKRREEFTRSLNEAYADGDVARLEQLSLQWDVGGDGSTGSPSTATSEELAASITASQAELSQIRAEIDALRATGLGRMLFGHDEPIAGVQALAQRVIEEVDRQAAVLERLRASR